MSDTHAGSKRKRAPGKAPPSAALLRWRDIIIRCLYDACDDGDIGAVYNLIRNSRLWSSRSGGLGGILGVGLGECGSADFHQFFYLRYKGNSVFFFTC